MRLEDCTGGTLALHDTDDADFRVLADGTVLARRHTQLHGRGKTFAVRAWDSTGKTFSATVTVKSESHRAAQVTLVPAGSL